MNGWRTEVLNGGDNCFVLRGQGLARLQGSDLPTLLGAVFHVSCFMFRSLDSGSQKLAVNIKCEGFLILMCHI